MAVEDSIWEEKIYADFDNDDDVSEVENTTVDIRYYDKQRTFADGKSQEIKQEI